MDIAGMEISYVEPWSKFIDEKIDRDLWDKAQEYFGDMYEGRKINEQIVYHSVEEFALKQRKQRLVYQIYSQMKDEAT